MGTRGGRKWGRRGALADKVITGASWNPADATTDCDIQEYGDVLVANDGSDGSLMDFAVGATLQRERPSPTCRWTRI